MVNMLHTGTTVWLMTKYPKHVAIHKKQQVPSENSSMHGCQLFFQMHEQTSNTIYKCPVMACNSEIRSLVIGVGLQTLVMDFPTHSPFSSRFWLRMMDKLLLLTVLKHIYTHLHSPRWDE